MGMFTTGLKIADVLGDLGGLEKLREMFSGGSNKTKKEEGEEMKGRPGQEHIVEATILEICAPYILRDAEQRKTFLTDAPAAHDRVAIDFYRRNPKLKDTYEKFLMQLPWWALGDGLGARTKQAPPVSAPQPQQSQKKGGGQQPNKATPPPTTLDSDNIRTLMIFKACLGMQALAADKEAADKGRKKPKVAGDRIIVETIERMRSASPFEKGKQALEKGGKSAGDFVAGFFDEI